MMHGVYAVLSTGSNAMSGRRSSVMMASIRQSLVPEVSGRSSANLIPCMVLMMHGVYAVLSTGSNAMSGRRS